MTYVTYRADLVTLSDSGGAEDKDLVPVWWGRINVSMSPCQPGYCPVISQGKKWVSQPTGQRRDGDEGELLFIQTSSSALNWFTVQLYRHRNQITGTLACSFV